MTKSKLITKGLGYTLGPVLFASILLVAGMSRAMTAQLEAETATRMN